VETPKDLFEIINYTIPREPLVPKVVKNDEISVNYVMNNIIWNRNEVSIDEAFAYNIAMNVMSDNKDQEPMTVEDC